MGTINKTLLMLITGILCYVSVTGSESKNSTVLYYLNEDKAKELKAIDIQLTGIWNFELCKPSEWKEVNQKDSICYYSADLYVPNKLESYPVITLLGRPYCNTKIFVNNKPVTSNNKIRTVTISGIKLMPHKTKVNAFILPLEYMIPGEFNKIIVKMDKDQLNDVSTYKLVSGIIKHNGKSKGITKCNDMALQD